jgi:hypothetical protein
VEEEMEDHMMESFKKEDYRVEKDTQTDMTTDQLNELEEDFKASNLELGETQEKHEALQEEQK